jgi:hypothetical protein
MRSTRADSSATTRALRLAVILLLAAGLSACGSTGPGPSQRLSTPPAGPSATTRTVGMPGTGVTSAPTAPTAVPGGQTVSPGSPATRIPTTQTDWGEILDAVPGDFPRYPGAKDAEPPAEPVSAALTTPAAVDKVARWYRDALDALGYATVNLSEPLEDGSRVLDSQGDLPECLIQSTFRPAGESTMITVLFGAGCAGVGG